MNPKLIKKQFEKSFETYDDNAIVQRILAERMVSKISETGEIFENVLELGSGTGLLTKELVKHIEIKNYCANDLVKKSEDCIKNIFPDARFYLGNALKIKPVQKFDLIISNAVFQWFENFESVCKNFKPMLKKDGLFAFTTFLPDNYREIADLTGLSLNYKTKDEIISTCEKYFKVLNIH